MSTAHELDSPAPASAGPAKGRKFPARPYTTAGSYFGDYAAELARAADTIEPAALDRAATILLDTYRRGGRVFACGNGGSAAIANHMECDQGKGLRTGTHLKPRFLSLSSNVEILTAIANDLSYDDVFSYQLQSQAAPGDAFVAVSSSGRSANIVRALAWARDNGVASIAITGFTGGSARTLADVAVHVDSTNYGVVEDLHQAITHALAQFLRQAQMTPDAISATVF